MSTLWIVIGIAVLIAALAVFFIWYQNRRSRESFSHIDHSKLNDLDQDGWDDDR
ncbi:hypothetical protein V5738_18190 [Salinisphaera sp. SPP-AMP-43]|uniref:hypothetical protein n=1 Tax=Salinisphaera sp. SPP-AMP-43 TaxID=3121288 RepID=UPI003C6DE343